MRTISHIVNPVPHTTNAELAQCQPLVFESMRKSALYAKDSIDVTLYTSQYPEDRDSLPSGFLPTRDLDRSVLDCASFRIPRKLPLLADVLDRLYETSNAEYFIYTNADIILLPTFYQAVNVLVEQGIDAMSITKRLISGKFGTIDELPMIYSEVGKPHSGPDCFVFRRSTYNQYYLGLVCLGVPGVGKALLINMAAHAKRFKFFCNLHLTCHLADSLSWHDEQLDDYAMFNHQEYKKVWQRFEKDLNNNADPTINMLRERAGMPVPPHMIPGKRIGKYSINEKSMP